MLLFDSRKHIEVHGRPSAAVFLLEGGRAGKTFYLLSWQVQSSAAILEYRLLYRRINMVSTGCFTGGSIW